MTSIKTSNNMITERIEGINLPGFTKVVDIWEYPTEYPRPFYYPETEVSVINITVVPPTATWVFKLKTVAQIKSLIHSENQKKRCLMQLGSFTYGGKTINLVDRQDANNINNIRTIVGSRVFKIGPYEWITLVPSDIEPLKDALDLHVQPSFDWEEAQYTLVEEMSTVDDLNTYWLSM